MFKVPMIVLNSRCTFTGYIEVMTVILNYGVYTIMFLRAYEFIKPRLNLFRVSNVAGLTG